jgi:hypothetical protein
MQINWLSFVGIAENNGDTPFTIRTASDGQSVHMFNSIARWRNVTPDGRMGVRRQPNFLQCKNINVMIDNYVVY